MHNRPDPKPQPNREKYLQILRAMTPEQRLMKTFELNDMLREMFYAAIRRAHPTASADEIERIARERRAKCFNRNY